MSISAERKQALVKEYATKTGDTAKSADAFKALGGACKACHEDFRKD